jgi:septum formation protein
LRAAGIDPHVVVSHVDEDAAAATLKNPTPEELVGSLAAAKANAVAEMVSAQHTNAVIVGCDSMLSLEGEMLGKPKTAEIARLHWSAMSGKTGSLLTGHTVIRLQDGQKVNEITGVHATDIKFAEVTQPEIDAYVETGEPLAVAGSFTLDGLGGWFVESINGHPSNVIGISLPLLRQLLNQLDLPVTSFWR